MGPVLFPLSPPPHAAARTASTNSTTYLDRDPIERSPTCILLPRSADWGARQPVCWIVGEAPERLLTRIGRFQGSRYGHHSTPPIAVLTVVPAVPPRIAAASAIAPMPAMRPVVPANEQAA